MRRSSAKLARRTLSGFDSAPIRILLAEDNPRHAQLLREAMGEAGVAFAGGTIEDLMARAVEVRRATRRPRRSSRRTRLDG